MNAQNIDKIVIVVAEETPAPIAANACALLSLTIGARHPQLIGPDVTDAGGRSHAGLSTLVVPILKAPAGTLRDLAAAEGVDVVDFTHTAARARDYDGYTETMAATAGDALDYIAISLAGPRKVINSLTGSLPLYR